jgi:hypothetical protein
VKTETTVCKACKQSMRWVLTDKGKTLAVDPEPSPHGNLVVREDGIGHIITKDDVMPPGVERFILHAVTCTEGPKERRKPLW